MKELLLLPFLYTTIIVNSQIVVNGVSPSYDAENYYYNESINNLPKFNLILDDENFFSLQEQLDKLQKIKRQDMPYLEKKKKFKGHLLFNEQKIKVKSKIVGMYNDHWKKDKPSLKFYFSSDTNLYNLNGFSLLNPSTRDYLGDWLAAKFEKEFNLLSLERDFVLLSFNNKKNKVYLLEESFKGFAFRNRNLGCTFSYKIVNNSVFIKMYNDDFDNQLKVHIENSLSKFILFPEKNNSIIDYNKMATYYVITDIVQGFHQFVEFNTHFFYNYKTKKIEPIGREWNSSQRNGLSKILSIDYVSNGKNNVSLFHRRIFEDLNFRNLYKKELKRLSKTDLTKFFENNATLIDLFSKCLWKDRGLISYDFEYIFKNFNYLRTIKL